MSDRAAGGRDNASVYWPTLLVVAALDLSSKVLAQTYLAPAYVPRELLGDAVRLTLAYNPGAAFGFHIGPASRWVFAGLAAVMLVVLWRVYESTPPGDTPRALGVALVSGGAAGNLVDRLRSPRGVVDFIDIGMGGVRFWTFNLADTAITLGAVLLVIVLSREDEQAVSVA